MALNSGVKKLITACFLIGVVGCKESPTEEKTEYTEGLFGVFGPVSIVTNDDSQESAADADIKSNSESKNGLKTEKPNTFIFSFSAPVAGDMYVLRIHDNFKKSTHAHFSKIKLNNKKVFKPFHFSKREYFLRSKFILNN